VNAPTERLQHLADVSRGMDDPLDVGYYECCALATEMLSAIQCLREIAAMGKKAGSASEAATVWLSASGYGPNPAPDDATGFDAERQSLGSSPLSTLCGR
jgi:hypothetical protein